MIPKKKHKSIFNRATDDGECISFIDLVDIFPELKEAHLEYLEDKKFFEDREEWIHKEMVRIHIEEGGYECLMSGIHDFWDSKNPDRVALYNRIREKAEDNFINRE